MGNNELDQNLKAFINSKDILKKEEIYELISKAQNGDIESRNKIIEYNLKLVLKFARKLSNNRIALEDFLQAGSIGIIKAIEKFDSSFGVEFSTYAAWWIKKVLRDEIINNNYNLRIPNNAYNDFSLLIKNIQILEKKLKRKPNNEEIAKYCEFSIDKVEALLRIQKNDVEIDNKENPLTNLIDFEKSPNSEDEVVENVYNKKLNNIVFSELPLLTDREKLIIKRRFGFDDFKPQTLQEIGDFYGLTKERVRQIEAKALAKIKNSEKFKQYTY